MVRSNLRCSHRVRDLLLLASVGALALACSESPPADNAIDAAAHTPIADSGASEDATSDASDAAPVEPKDAASDQASIDSGDADASTHTGANWMGAIAGSTSIAGLSIPGTHDTGARVEVTPGTTKCQDLTVPDQLSAGIRYFDIRCRNVGNKFDIYHTNVYQNLSFDDVLQSIFSFFASNPGETIIMSMKEEQPASNSTNTFEQTFDAYAALHPDRWYLAPTIPTLDQARGKIVLLRRFGAASVPKGIDATVWADNTTFTINNGSATLRIQDYYEVSDDNAKWTSIVSLLSEAKQGSPTTLFLNNMSAYQPLDGGLENIPSVSDVINPKAVSYFTANTSGRFGIVAMDFADMTKSSLILSTNFK
jgi:1-phosphatidylinositol phosphodiesterase